MSNGYAADEPRHVEMAAIDEDIRTMAIEGACSVLWWCCAITDEGLFKTNETWLSERQIRRDLINRALRVLRHYGLLVEHGDGVVSVKEQA